MIQQWQSDIEDIIWTATNDSSATTGSQNVSGDAKQHTVFPILTEVRGGMVFLMLQFHEIFASKKLTK